MNTVNVGKYNPGWAGIGICTHAFYEAINHAGNRNLYHRYVTDFPHIRRLRDPGTKDFSHGGTHVQLRQAG